MMTRFIPLSLAAAIIFLAWPLGAAAHVHLDRSEPAKDAVVSESPTVVKLWFSGRIEPDFSTIEVTNAEGERVDSGSTTAGSNRRTIETTLGELVPGEYLVNWSVIARDGHRIRGDYRFTVD